MRKNPYTEKGIKRLRCYRCNNPAYSQWQICADNNVYRPLCKRCDILLNKLVLEFMNDLNVANKILKYEQCLSNLELN